ncbi:agmatinase [Chromatiales bacterium (ex Bugula neritina AB1)]|nr:agmatinase [Chromatiales bacterium (ex Bugula neritina AB1)]
MADTTEFTPEQMMDSLYWWGVPTLFGCEHHQRLDEIDIALLGVPHAAGNGTTERDQHLGPRAVRNVSRQLRRVHLEFDFDPWKNTRIADVGDVPFPEANDNEACIERITGFINRLDTAGVNPVSIGGDHSITGGIVQALGGGKLAGGQAVSLLHIDAHTDVFEQLDHFLGAKKSAAHWGSYLVHQGDVDAESSVQLGMRGNPRTLDWLKPSYDLGYQVVPMQQYREMGTDNACTLIRNTIGDRPVYVTFDLDSLDPTVAPAVSNLEPAEEGLKMNEARKLIQCLRGLNVIGGDVVCMMPTKDSPNNITAYVATAIMFEIMCLIADNKQ